MSTLLPDRADAVSALGDPQRLRLYRLAAGRGITRDDAAEALGVPRSTAAFHLERLVEAGLVSVEFIRPSGRTGPGAGRPAKRYRADASELSVTIPERHYELAGSLLAAAVEESEADGIPVREALAAQAFAAGAAIGGGCAGLEDALVACGYSPRETASGGVILDNCPFHALATRHTDLICGANLHLARGLAAATGDERTPVLAPADGRCCVEIRAGER